MKRILISIVLSIFVYSSFAQTHKWYPNSATQQKCYICGGSGYNTFTGYKCTGCGGRGYTSMTYESGANNGLAAALITKGKNFLCSKLYRQAFDCFLEVYQNIDKHNAAGHVCYWMGICYEFGFGVNSDRNTALSMYKYSMEQNFPMGAEEYNRVIQEGFYPATEEYRESFINYQKQKDIENAIRFQAMQGIYEDMNQLQQEQIEDMRKERENRTRTCPVCKGAGYYSNPNEQWFSEGTYTCRNCGKVQSYSHHHSCRCKRCGGSGSVRW